MSENKENTSKAEGRRDRIQRKRKQQARLREQEVRFQKFWASLGEKRKKFLYILGGSAILGLLAILLADFVEWGWQFALAGFILIIPFPIAYEILRRRFRIEQDKLIQEQTALIQPEPYISPPKTPTSGKEIIASESHEIKTSNSISKEHKEEIEVSIITPESVSTGIQEKIAEEDLDEKCSVCTTPILKNERYIRCSYCTAPAHQDHLMKWLKHESICPNCKARIRES